MKVLLTHPFFWPHVRRGAEREVHDLGVRLRAAGDDARLMTGAPDGVLRRGAVDGLPVTWVRTPVPRVLERRGWTAPTVFGGVAAVGAALSRADLVHAFLYADAAGVALADRLLRRRRPLVLKLTGTVLPERMRELRVDRELFRRALEGADEVWVNSRWASEQMAGFGVPMRIVPAGLDEQTFRPGPPRRDEPVVLCAQAPTDPRKRLVDLLDAWPAVVDAVPGAQLQLAGSAPAPVRQALLERLPAALRSTVVFLGDLPDTALAEAYARARVVVTPSVHEALGLTGLEALACGTPVAGARSGATPEILTAGAGALFAPLDPQDCARAIVELLTAPTDGLVDRCRAAALPWAWPGVVTTVRERYAALLGD